MCCFVLDLRLHVAGGYSGLVSRSRVCLGWTCPVLLQCRFESSCFCLGHTRYKLLLPKLSFVSVSVYFLCPRMRHFLVSRLFFFSLFKRTFVWITSRDGFLFFVLFRRFCFSILFFNFFFFLSREHPVNCFIRDSLSLSRSFVNSVSRDCYVLFILLFASNVDGVASRSPPRP